VCPLRLPVTLKDKEIFHTVLLFSFRFRAKIILKKLLILSSSVIMCQLEDCEVRGASRAAVNKAVEPTYCYYILGN